MIVSPTVQPPTDTTSINVPHPDNIPAAADSFVLSGLEIAYIKSWSLYVCVQCHRGINPIELATHMHKHHGIQTNQQWKDKLNEAFRLYPGQDPMIIPVSGHT
jgi:hypothetical protein